MNITFPMDFGSLSSLAAMRQFKLDVADSVAAALGLDPSWVEVQNVRQGSVIADIVVLIPNTMNSTADLNALDIAVKGLLANPDSAFTAVKDKYHIMDPVKATEWTAAMAASTDNTIAALNTRVSQLLRIVIGIAVGCGSAVLLVAIATLIIMWRRSNGGRGSADSFDAVVTSHRYDAPAATAAQVTERVGSLTNPLSSGIGSNGNRAKSAAVLADLRHAGVERSAASLPTAEIIVPGAHAWPSLMSDSGSASPKQLLLQQRLGIVGAQGPTGVLTPAALPASPSPSNIPKKVPKLPQLPVEVRNLPAIGHQLIHHVVHVCVLDNDVHVLRHA